MNILINKGNISNCKKESHIHLVIDKVQCSTITKQDDKLEINWSVTEVDKKVFNNLKLEMNKIIHFLIHQSPFPEISYKAFKTTYPSEIYHPFSGQKK